MFDMNKLYEICGRIDKYLEANGCDGGVAPYGYGRWIVSVDVTGDWKHDHLRLDYLMEQIGAALLQKNVTEEDGSDWYSATHVFAVNRIKI